MVSGVSGLKDFAGLSTGEVVEAERFYRDLEPKLAVSQRARKKARTRARSQRDEHPRQRQSPLCCTATKKRLSRRADALE